jgi:hypothetical protein
MSAHEQAEQTRLRAYLRERGDGTGPLFLSRKRDYAPTQQQLDRLIKRYAAAAGIERTKR